MPLQADHYIIRMLPPAPANRNSLINSVLTANGYVLGAATVDFDVDSMALNNAYMIGLLLVYENTRSEVNQDRTRIHTFSGAAHGKLIAVFHK